jgi:cysteine desulfurase/selenocysteine lyase
MPISGYSCTKTASDIENALSPLDRSCLYPPAFSFPAREFFVPDHAGVCKAQPGSVRDDFPILSEKVNGKPLIWLDNAATTQKPSCVIDRIKYFYEHENSNVHRGAHTLAQRATEAYEGARSKAASFLNAGDPREIIFVRGTTEAVNLAANSYGVPYIKNGDVIVISALEHHANIVPWQMVCQKTGAVIKVIPADDRGELMLEEYERMLAGNVKLVAFTHVSNAIGTVAPAAELVKMAHEAGAAVLIDGAQAAAHMPVDVQALDCDFYAFSGHKAFGPTGTGILYAKADIQKRMVPFQGGGGMIEDVTFEKTIFKDPPYMFEAGTGSIADAAGLGAALDYVAAADPKRICVYEHKLLEYAVREIQKVPCVTVIGAAKCRSAIVSFTVKDRSPEEIGRALDREGIAVRAGHHCAQPILRRLGLESTARISFALYNTFEEIDELVHTLKKCVKGNK